MISIDIFDTALYADSYDFFSKCRSENELLEHCVANKEILKVYNLYKDKFLFISEDNYSLEFLRKLLYKCGYDHPTVFVPENKSVSKIDGSFFNEIEKEIGEKITIHYGDDYEKDIEGALKAGIKAVFNPAPSKINVDIPKVKDKQLKQYLVNALVYSFNERIELKPIKTFAALMAPVLLTFANWVMNEGDGPIFISKSLFPVYSIIKEVLGYEAFYINLDNNEDSCILINKEGNIISFNQVPTTERKILSFKDDFLKDFNGPMGCVKFFLESDNHIKVPRHTKKPIVKGETIKKTYYFDIMYKQLLESCNQIKYLDFKKEDILLVLDFVRSNKLFYPLYNDPNVIEKNEVYRSCLNYNRELIKEGYLRNLYEASYDQDLFKQVLKEDFEYCSLIELL